MAATNKNQVSVSGITPAAIGENWFVIDQSGDFFIDKSITATIWLVGGGCDGEAGIWNGNQVESDGNPTPGTGTGTSYSGAGGDGGYVSVVTNISIAKNQTLTSVIAEINDKSGTSLNTGNSIYRCDNSGYVSCIGGNGGELPYPNPEENEGYTNDTKKWIKQDLAILSKGGTDGVSTPYGFVGSSGGGGTVCNGLTNADNGVDGGKGAGNGQAHRSPGTNASNYGCGGGGGAVCGYIAQGQSGGKGKKGCIIISYVIEQSTFVVQRHYKKVCNTHKTCNTDYYSNNSHHACCTSDSGSCGCGNSNSNQGYSDSIPVNTTTVALQRKTDKLSQELQNAESENTALQSRINELQTQIDMLK